MQLEHPHKYIRKVKAFTFQGLACLLQAVTKISKVMLQPMAISRDETEH